MPKTTLQTLPAELRNYIYELAFASDHNAVRICEATPPSKDLLLTCRQFYDEARQMYRAEYRSYWSLTPFYLNDSREITAADKEHFKSLDAQDVEHVRDFSVALGQSTSYLENGAWRNVIRGYGMEIRSYCVAVKILHDDSQTRSIHYEEIREDKPMQGTARDHTRRQVSLKEQIQEALLRVCEWHRWQDKV